MFKKLLTVQKHCGAVKKDSKNSHMGNRYASLEAILSELIPVVNEAGLFLTQNVDYESNEGQKTWFIETIIFDAEDKTSNSLKLGKIPVINTKGDAQGLGSAITYARRYGLAAAFGLWQTDDDANVSCGYEASKASLPFDSKGAKKPALAPAAKPVVANNVTVTEVQEKQEPAKNTGVEAVIAPVSAVLSVPPADAAPVPFDYLSNPHRKMLTEAVKKAKILPAKLTPVREWFENGSWKTSGLIADVDAIAAKITEIANA